MGAAAYNRGSAAISRGFDAERPAPELVMLRDLTDWSTRHDGRVAFEPTVVRFGPGDGEFSLMNRPDRGWGERSITYDSLWALAKEWRLAFTEFGHDRHSRYVAVVPIPK